ncbi:ABC transporter G family member 22 [Gracilariopsis chorda]|uniref:Probable ATP-dependent transporter ycf16 n=1 Tax=Gracilariopsis chorda TaxID=448386 RepID=A0A2V3IIG8_9FLOR|nr:ABC transporter G family member 22 [Gracilariopsis chorda]|eukprot:PXF41838.1 ABC transporter G family member 22 [Gracilariopsis chorda]
MTSVETVTHNGVDITYDPNEELDFASELSTSARHTQRVDLVWKDLTLSVPVKVKRNKKSKTEGSKLPDAALPPEEEQAQRRKTILKGISGEARAGTMLAVMGSSGAGKTSLLNLLAGRVSTSKGAKASGSVFLNGEARNYNKFRKLAAYVLQDDDMFAELTVEEQLTYAALLRLPSSMPREKKLMRVQKIIQELGLGKVKDTMIGSHIVRGISGGERKRVNIGTELVTNPSLLFLDEPTTGLDSFNALNVMTALRQLALNGRTIISTIHQPRSSIFALFDQLCLLSEGRVMYFGPAKDAVTYFSALNFRSPSQFNPADFFLDLLSVDPRSAEREANTKARVEYIGDKYAAQATPIAAEAQGVPDMEAAAVEEENDSNDKVQLRETMFQTNWFNEFRVLCTRAMKLAFRERAANGARLGQVIFFSILLGLIWLNNGRKESLPERQSLAGVLFFIVINQSFGGVFAVIFGFPLERSVVTRERASNMYRTSSYFLSKTATDLPKTLFFNTLFSIIVYWMVGFKETAAAFFIFVLIIFLTSVLSESLAIAVSIMTGDAQTAAGIIPVFIILALLFGGFFIESGELDGWISWAKYLSFIFYAFNALGHNEFPGRPHGEKILQTFNNLTITENILVLFAILIIFRLIGYLFLKFLRGPKFLKLESE